MIRTAAGVAGVVLAATLVGQPPPVETGPITLVTGVDLSHGKIRQALVDDWNQQHPDTPVRVVELPSSADLQHAQMLAAEQAGDTTYDVLNLDLTWTAEFADNNAIVPLDDEMLGDGGAGDFVAKALESGRYRDKLWAVPFNTDVGLLYYRKDIVGAKGLPLPTKWGDLVDAKQSVQPPMHVFTTQLKRYEGLTVNVVEASASQNEDLTGSGGLLAIAAGLRDGTILPDSTTYDEAGALEAFRGNKAMFMRNWPYAYDVMASDMPDFQKNVGVTRLPWPAVLGGQNLAVARNSTKPRLARELIRFLTSPNSEQCLLERGGLAATRKRVYTSGHLTCQLGQASATGPAEGKPAPTLYETPDAMKVLNDSLNTAVLRPVTPYYSQTTEVIQALASDTLRDTTDPAYTTTAGQLPDQVAKALTGR